MKGTCHVCRAFGEVHWCVSCAQDTCARCWPKHVPDCFNASEHLCHRCDKGFPTFTSVGDMEGSVVMQAITGRMFHPECFGGHMSDEGF